ncbi:MAG TPA: hypothetical protein VGQ20_17340 [Acidimicrobiales bacterium]|nr:hypothetical protein [Acidimicrobiales bacterium]
MLAGTASLEELTAHAATLDDFGTDALTLPGAEVFQALFEIRVTGRQTSLPPSLHPTNPPTFVFQFWRCPESPWGPFALAQGRVGSRSGLRPRGHVQGCICDNAEAAAALRQRWGFPAQSGTIRLQRGYDVVNASVHIGTQSLAALTALDPDPLAPEDVSYATTVALANTPRGLRLVQIDTDLSVQRAERLHPRLDQFDAAPWVHESIVPYYPVSASIASGNLTLQRLRYVCRPDELAFSGTETIAD